MGSRLYDVYVSSGRLLDILSATILKQLSLLYTLSAKLKHGKFLRVLLTGHTNLKLSNRIPTGLQRKMRAKDMCGEEIIGFVHNSQN